MIFDVDMKLARSIAYKYGLKQSEAKVFALSWQLRQRSDHFTDQWKDHLQTEVEDGYHRMAALVRDQTGQTAPPRSRGHAIVRKHPTHGQRYVIFSDHHWTYPEHRQDFFGRSGNRELYVDILQHYLDRDFTLVENGDVEELLVYEPTEDEVQSRLEMGRRQLHRHRLQHRLSLLQRILEAPALQPLYDLLAQFQSRQHLIRVAGNHDTDLQRPAFHHALADRIPGVLRPCDYLLLQSPGTAPHTQTDPGAHSATRTDYVIAHGHQFDKNTNGRFAGRIGETVSETMAWAFQGADRTWAWSDDVAHWVGGRNPFPGSLVTDGYDRSRGTLLDAAAMVFGQLHSKDAWEAIFKHSIAWEYFEYDDPQDILDKEVRTGDEFFKFRHLDEHLLKSKLHHHFEDHDRPTLVLGHTHEARLFTQQTHAPLNEQACRWYANTGSAGRFENMIWGLEIDDGQPTLVSWSRPTPRSGIAQRRTWQHHTERGKHWLI